MTKTYAITEAKIAKLIFTSAGGDADGIAALIESLPLITGEQDLTTGKWYAGEDIDRMVRELDVALYGKNAARQAMLCDIVQPLIKRLAAQPLQPITATMLDDDEWTNVWIDCSDPNQDEIEMSLFAEKIQLAFCEKNGIKHKGDTK